MMSDFLLYSGHLGYHVRKLLILFIPYTTYKKVYLFIPYTISEGSIGWAYMFWSTFVLYVQWQFGFWALAVLFWSASFSDAVKVIAQSILVPLVEIESTYFLGLPIVAGWFSGEDVIEK